MRNYWDHFFNRVQWESCTGIRVVHEYLKRLRSVTLSPKKLHGQSSILNCCRVFVFVSVPASSIEYSRTETLLACLQLHYIEPLKHIYPAKERLKERRAQSCLLSHSTFTAIRYVKQARLKSTQRKQRLNFFFRWITSVRKTQIIPKIIYFARITEKLQ